ncbi:MAG: class B sortase [Atopobiaceae bacterium]|nr:class B sortase [Atopobiaceae bacterium]MCI2172826.1 class B sortase [Atopobiaceae bacterium]MCI2207133.1 class B sortase [Atopobiaceae bacterium]
MSSPRDKGTDAVGTRIVRVADGVINAAILVALTALLAFGAYAVWDADQVNEGASSDRWSEYKPTQTMSLSEIQSVNPDIIGWVEIYGTGIDYPIAHCADNETYVNHDALGDYSLTGCPFLDRAAPADFSAFDNIVYGHHMEAPVMFGELGDFDDASYFESHEYGTIWYDGSLHGLTIIAAADVDAYDQGVYSIVDSGGSAAQAYLERAYASASQSRQVGTTSSDHLVVLSTCASGTGNARHVLLCQITDDVQPDPFATQDTASSVPKSNPFMQLPWWLWVILAILVAALVDRAITHWRLRRMRRRAEKDDLRA